MDQVLNVALKREIRPERAEVEPYVGVRGARTRRGRRLAGGALRLVEAINKSKLATG